MGIIYDPFREEMFYAEKGREASEMESRSMWLLRKAWEIRSLPLERLLTRRSWLMRIFSGLSGSF